MDSLVRWDLLDVLKSNLAIDPHAISDETHLVGDLGFDSVMFAIAAVAIEERLGVVLAADRLNECATFGQVVTMVEQLERSARTAS